MGGWRLCVINSHGNYIVDHGKIMEKSWNLGLNFCVNPDTLPLLHSIFMLSVVKMSLKGEVGGHALNSLGNYIVDHGKSWKNHGIVFLNFCGNLYIAKTLIRQDGCSG